MSLQALIHFSEIALKGKNRAFFENKLRDNIIATLKPKSIKKLPSVFLVDSVETDKLKNVFGVAYYAEVKTLPPSSGDSGSLDLTKMASLLTSHLKNNKFKTFKIQAKRSDKTYKSTSQEINEQVGDLVRIKLDKKVDLSNPDLTIYIEIIEGQVYVYTEKIKGPGGLPVGVSGKLVSLLSAGIDSPVASYLMMKRGAEIIFTHFHSYPFTSKNSQENVKEIIKVLEKYQVKAKLYSIPIGEYQKQISVKAPSNLRIILYRRLMIKIANQIAQKEKALGLVTGESLGQVASQTLENMQVTNQASNLPIYRPLISHDKQEIVDLAQKLGTYKISIRPYDDCCTYLAPTRVATKAKLEQVLKVEKDLKLEALLKSEKFDIIRV